MSTHEEKNNVDKARLKELKTALAEKVSEQKQLADNFRIDGGRITVTAEQKSAFDSNTEDIKSIRGLIESLEGMKGLNDWASASEGESVAYAAGYHQSHSAKSVGQMFVESGEFKALNGGANGLTMHSSFDVKGVDLKTWMAYAQKDVFSAMPSGTPGSFGTTQRDPIVPMPQRTRRVRDLFPSRTTNAAIIEYFRQTGFTNAASTVGERNGNAFGLKPQSSMSFKGEQAPVRTIAHWEAAHRNVLADEPQLRALIDNELLYGLRLEEDKQILLGSGTGDDLLGILETPDIQEYAWSDGAITPQPDNKADAIRRAATLAFLANYEPTGIVVHPNDWEDMELTKDTNGQYLLAVSIQNGADARIWRMPVIDTPAIPEGTALVGAFGLGAQLFDRESASIRVAEQHADFFVRNGIVVLAEERLALAVKRPESFVKVSFDAEPA